MGVPPSKWTLENMPDTFSGIVKRLKHPACPKEILLHYARISVFSYHVAKRDDCTPELLRILASSSDTATRRRVAQHKLAPPDLLSVLALDVSPNVRMYVAINPNTPPAALQKLARDRNNWVTTRVAERHPELFRDDPFASNYWWTWYSIKATPEQFVRAYRNTRSNSARIHLLLNDLCPRELIFEAVSTSKDVALLETASRRTDLDDEIFLLLAQKAVTLRPGRMMRIRYRELLRNILSDLRCPENILLMFSMDGDSTLSDIARQTLMQRKGEVAC